MQIINKLFRYKDVYIFFILKVLFIIFFSTTFLHASSFKVTDIEVSSPFELDFNKNKVIDDGFKVSFYNLISIITTSGDKDKIKNISLKELKGMIDSFAIKEERFVNDEYFAKLEVTFNKKNIFSFLEKKNIFPSIPIKNKILLIPILVDLESENIYLFDKNVFYQKWNEDIKNYHLLEYLLPSEDLEDLSIIQKNYNTIEDYNFLDLVRKYDLEDYIIVILFKDKNDLKVHSKINFKDSFKVDNQIYQKVNLDDEKNFQLILENLKKNYEDYWKKDNEINTSIKLPITISIDSKKYNKIKKFEKKINNIDLVSDFYVLKFDNNNIFFRIIFNGSPKIFLNYMNENDFELKMENNIWKIK